MKKAKRYLKAIGDFLKESVKDGFKYLLSFVFLGVLIYAYSLTLGVSLGDVKSEQILTSIRHDIPKKNTAFEIKKLNLRGIGDDSIVVFAHENIDESLDKENGTPAQKSYPGIYVFSKFDSPFDPLRKAIFGDSFYRKEFELEFLPSKGDAIFETGSFDRLKFGDIRTLGFGEQKIVIFSLLQDGFTLGNTYKYYGILKYSFDKGGIVIEPMISEGNGLGLGISESDMEYLKNECRNTKKEMEGYQFDTDCDKLSTSILPKSKIEVVVNGKEGEIQLTPDLLVSGYWNAHFSQDNERLRYLNSLYGKTDSSCHQCPHDYLVTDYKFARGRYEPIGISLLRRDSKEFDIEIQKVLEFNTNFLTK